MNYAAEHSKIQIYDTTLRDGAQQRGINLTVEDKLRCTQLLANFGIHYIEGGWPGSNPKDEEYFYQARQLTLGKTKLAAFGSTRRKDCSAADDPQVIALLEAQTPVVTLVGKASRFQVQELLRTSLEENVKMIFETVSLVKREGREVIFDAEHFFDGLAQDREYSLACLKAAVDAGADTVVLCDTNGGTLPLAMLDAVRLVAESFLKKVRIGIHTHNDTDSAVANSILAVQAGASHVQGTINGYGERCGNANLISVLPALVLKLGYELSLPVALNELTSLSRQVAELVNENHRASQPYVGRSAFAHKGGLHVAAVERCPESYEHIDPHAVGNNREIVVSELSGRGNVRFLARDAGVGIGELESEVLAKIKEREFQGYAYETAEASAEILMRRLTPDYFAPFEVLESTVISQGTVEEEARVQAAVKVRIGNEVFHTVADGAGPVHALDTAIRKALLPSFPHLQDVRLTNYKVRILNPNSATGAKTRVIIEAGDTQNTWVTLGCSENIISASLEALLDSYELYLVKSMKESDARLQKLANDSQ